MTDRSMSASRWKELFGGPVLLAPDNFTPLSRTPWAGKAIARFYKDDIAPEYVGSPIGEAWEFSCDPAFSSKLAQHDVTLNDFVAVDPQAVLGERVVARGKRSCEILVKLLNAAEPLSLQVHPEDGDAALTDEECGKPESWFVLQAEAGAGIYLGFAKQLEPSMLRQMITDQVDLKPYLNFVEVQAGDYFEIEPGMLHAVGPGVTLLEPQRIVPGKSGKTYRLWDWNRRYDSEGRYDSESGSPRELHVEAGLRLVNPMDQVGGAFVGQARRQARQQALDNGVLVQVFPANEYYQVFHVAAPVGAEFELNVSGGYGAFIMLEGAVTSWGQSGKKVGLPKGQPALFPNRAMPLHVRADQYVECALIIPAESSATFS